MLVAKWEEGVVEREARWDGRGEWRERREKGVREAGWCKLVKEVGDEEGGK